jgi:hypothetical protein
VRFELAHGLVLDIDTQLYQLIYIGDPLSAADELIWTKQVGLERQKDKTGFCLQIFSDTEANINKRRELQGLMFRFDPSKMIERQLNMVETALDEHFEKNKKKYYVVVKKIGVFASKRIPPPPLLYGKI